MDEEKFDHLLREANTRLKLGRTGIVIECRGNFLNLRGIFPQKPGHHDKRAKQQRLSLNIRANETGLRFVEAKARFVSGLLAMDRFDWEPYLNPDPPQSLEEWVSRFRDHYFETHPKNPQGMDTWKHDYQAIFSKLPEKFPTEKIFRELILTTTPDTRTRRRYVLSLAALGDFIGWDHSLRRLIGRYSPRTVTPRDLPSDLAIAEIYSQLEPSFFRWAYAVMAIYGLRNHEVYFCDLEDFPICFVRRGKTGARFVYPIYPEWAEAWDIEAAQFDTIGDPTQRLNSYLGHRITQKFKALKIPFSPYTLRHCWARRSLEFGLDISLAAAQMGHSMRVHSEIYHHWISKDVHERAFDDLLSRDDRPKAPQIR
jgi:integrase